MENDNNNLISKFLENEMDEGEARLFRLKYDTEPEFRSEVNEQSGIFVALQTAGRIHEQKMALRSKSDQKLEIKTGEIWNHAGIVMKIAAVLVPLLLVGSLIYFLPVQRVSTNKLIGAAFESALKKVEVRSFTNQQISLSSQVQTQIDNSILESLDNLERGEETFRFGLYCIQNKRYTEAIFSFRRVIGSQDKSLMQESEWLLALCYMQIGDIEKARTTLRSIAGLPDHKYRQESLKLLRKI